MASPGTLQRRSTPARRSERRSALTRRRSVPARCPISFLSFHHSILSFWPSLWLPRSTLQRRSAPARRPKLPSFPFFRPLSLPSLSLYRGTLQRRSAPARRPKPFFRPSSWPLAFSFACPWHTAAPLGARSAPARRPKPFFRPSSWPSLSLSRGTLQRRSAPARRPLGALSHSSVLLPGLLFRCPVARCSAARRPLGALSHSSVLLHGLLFRCPVARCSAARRPKPFFRPSCSFACPWPAAAPLGARSAPKPFFRPSSWPSLSLSRGTLQRRSAPARRPKLPSFPFFRPFFLAFSFAVPWHAAAPLGARSAP